MYDADRLRYESHFVGYVQIPRCPIASVQPIPCSEYHMVCVQLAYPGDSHADGPGQSFDFACYNDAVSYRYRSFWTVDDGITSWRIDVTVDSADASDLDACYFSRSLWGFTATKHGPYGIQPSTQSPHPRVQLGRRD